MALPGPAAWIASFASRLRYPQLFFLTAAIFVVDLVVPDPIPFVDEILLGLLTLLLGGLADRHRPPPKTVTPPDPR